MGTAAYQLIKTNTLIISAFVFFFFTHLFYWLPRDVMSKGMRLWVYTDWLIDYSFGFTRRGLSGELLNLTSSFAQPIAIIGFLSWLTLGAVFFGYVRLCTQAHSILRPFLLGAILFLPSLLPFYLYDHGAFGRKETIGFLFLLCHLYSLESYGNAQATKSSLKIFINNYIKKLLLITVILLPLHVFVHEASFFLFVPAHVLITYSILRLDPSINLRKKLICLTFIYLPVILAFFAVFIFGRPSFGIALAICEKWELANALEPGSCSILGKDTMWALPGALTSLPWSFSQAASLTLSFSLKTIFAWIFIIIVLGFYTAYIGIWVNRSFIYSQFNEFSETAFVRRHSRLMCYKYFLLPLLISVPLYIVGWDIGRWFAVSCINYAMISMSKDINYADFRVVYRGKATAWVPAQTLNFGESSRFYHFKLFFMLLIIFFVRMPHCCNNGFNMLAEPIKSVAKYIMY